jgi:hypothetical protein
MDDHAEGHDFSKSRAISVLDWPTPEQLAEARRLRGQALREMTVALFQRLKRLVAEHTIVPSAFLWGGAVFVPRRSGHGRPHVRS